MINISKVRKHITDFHFQNEDSLVNGYFLYFLLMYTLDLIFNFFQLVPFFVATSLVIFPLLFISTQILNSERNQLYILIFSFAFISLLNSVFQSFHVKNISDLLFISLFITIYYYYKNQINNLNNKYANLHFFWY